MNPGTMSLSLQTKPKTKPIVAATERQKALLTKYTTSADLDEVHSIFDVADDFLSVLGDVTDPLSWFDLFSDGWSLFNMGNARDSSQEALEDLLKSVGSMSDTLDNIRQVMESQGATQEEINEKLDIIMAAQQANTAKILDAINGVAGAISQMWANTSAWLSTMQQQLNVMSSMLSGIGAAIQDLIAKVEELESHVDWGSVVSALTEYQLRVTYAAEVAQNIRNANQKGAEDDDDGGSAVQYDTQELDEWARKTCDLATGLNYYLEALHRLIMGDFVLGKPLMFLYFKLFRDQKPADPKIARLYGYLVAVQAQGYSVLAKAREYLGLRSIDIKQILDARLQSQAQVVMANYVLATPLGLWLGSGAQEYLLEDYRSDPNVYYDRYFMVPSPDRVACGITVVSNGELVYLHLHHGTIVAGTTLVENVEETEMSWDGPGRAWGSNFFHVDRSSSDDQSLEATYNSADIVVGSEYAIVGLKLQGGGEDEKAIPKLLPVVSRWDPTTGTTEWTGTHSTVTVAIPADGDETVELDLDSKIYMSGDDPANRTWGMMRGVKVAFDAQSCRVKVCYTSTGLAEDTWLPFEYPETEDLTYENVDI
ncbi:hypothetical protein BDV25DRAFT_149784 [Aspergillus avenaceus]|uniref:Uncharacterized protein n=1 Tax=Aspergillus avenaceus TaxID=36643 RepID=A0A5N6U3U2_ASPAV|nr:hypothetical protein BDV25DRAFT_149784 [Aspergillus avenaceus]